MPQVLNARVQQLQAMNRAEHFDSEGGGRITRVLYCEPYTAHKRIVTALKGTVYPGAGGRWERARPHADPLYPWFYCTDVQVEPAFPSAVRASPSKKFNAGVTDAKLGQFYAIQSALNVIDDFDGASEIDNLHSSEIKAGQKTYPLLLEGSPNPLLTNTDESFDNNAFLSAGRCGARITASYSPLLFQPGIIDSPGGLDKFDYVDPQWEPLTLSTATGRDLGVLAPTNQWPFDPSSVLKSGLNDSYALPEVVWRFSIRRLMVPFIPARTIALFANKVNTGAQSIGSVRFPNGTLRMETPEIITRRAPDGQLMHEILLKFLVRRLWDEHWDVGAGAYTLGWISWNEAFCRPANGWFDSVVGQVPASYYPVVWSADIFPVFGIPHPLFIGDNDAPLNEITLDGGDARGLTQFLMGAPFQAGMRDGQ